MRTGRPKQPLTLSAEECERLASLAHRARTLTPIGAAGADRGSRQLGVSHTYIQKLVREYAADPSSMLREQRLFGPVTLAGLRRAREETQKLRERGWLRRPRLWKTVEFKVGDNVLRAVVPTKADAGAVAADNAVPPEMRRPGQPAR